MACKCGSEEFLDLPGEYKGGHKVKRICAVCGAYMCWVKGADSDAARRPAKHKELVRKYSRGFCELCLRTQEEIPLPQVLEAHHVKEYSDGGEERRDNIWIVCTSCSRLIHHQRTYLGHYKEKESVKEEMGWSPENQA